MPGSGQAKGLLIAVLMTIVNLRCNGGQTMGCAGISPTHGMAWQIASDAGLAGCVRRRQQKE